MSTSTPITQYVLVRRTGLSPDAFAERTGLHPDLARKLVALGLLDANHYAGGEMSFDPSEVTHAARIQRLRTGLGLNYTAIGSCSICWIESKNSKQRPTEGGRPDGHRQLD